MVADRSLYDLPASDHRLCGVGAYAYAARNSAVSCLAARPAHCPVIASRLVIWGNSLNERPLFNARLARAARGVGAGARPGFRARGASQSGCWARLGVPCRVGNGDQYFACAAGSPLD